MTILSLPICLGMIEYDCCGTGKQNTNENAEWQQVKKARPASCKSKATLSPLSQFIKTCNKLKPR